MNCYRNNNDILNFSGADLRDNVKEAKAVKETNKQTIDLEKTAY